MQAQSSAALVSHLFAQGEVAARLFLMLPEFRDQLRGLLAAQPALTALVPDGRPDLRAYEIVYGIVRRGTGPIGLGFHASTVPGRVEAMSPQRRVSSVSLGF